MPEYKTLQYIIYVILDRCYDSSGLGLLVYQVQYLSRAQVFLSSYDIR